MMINDGECEWHLHALMQCEDEEIIRKKLRQIWKEILPDFKICNAVIALDDS